MELAWSFSTPRIPTRSRTLQRSRIVNPCGHRKINLQLHRRLDTAISPTSKEMVHMRWEYVGNWLFWTTRDIDRMAQIFASSHIVRMRELVSTWLPSKSEIQSYYEVESVFFIQKTILLLTAHPELYDVRAIGHRKQLPLKRLHRLWASFPPLFNVCSSLRGYDNSIKLPNIDLYQFFFFFFFFFFFSRYYSIY